MPVLCLFLLLQVCLAGPALGRVQITHPDVAGDGEAFPVNFQGGRANKSVQVSWRGKELRVPLTFDSKTGTSRGQCLLSIPLDSQEQAFILQIKLEQAENVFGNGLVRVGEGIPVPSCADPPKTYTAQLRVEQRVYPTQELTVEPKYVEPPAELAARIEREQAEMRAALEKVIPARYWKEAAPAPRFTRPVPGSVSSLYGLRRVLNGQPRSPHKGLDLRGKEGTPVKACAAGQVVLAAHHYYAGKVVVVDHGLGVKTIYMHLSAITVKKGQKVTAGQIVGKVGKTGRSTGPHLHLGLHVLGETVNPATFIPGLGL